MMKTHHSPECCAGRDTPAESDQFLDYFCECHEFCSPLQLGRGNIAWPSSWTRHQAARWRMEHKCLERAGSESAPQAAVSWIRRLGAELGLLPVDGARPLHPSPLRGPLDNKG